MTEKKPFWSSLPGILTAFAGLITAMGGLLVVLHQIGIIGGPPEELVKSQTKVIVDEDKKNLRIPTDISFSELRVKGDKDYRFVEEGLADGERVFIDRGYVFKNVPMFLRNASYIITANEDKFNADDNFMSFQVGRPVLVYVAHDDRYTNKPLWLVRSFKDSRLDVIIANVSYSLYERKFPEGIVTLGGNIAPGEKGNYGMYSVILLGQ